MLMLSLNSTFSIDNVPWKQKNAENIIAPDARLVAVPDGPYLILGGLRNTTSLVAIYDIGTNSWTQQNSTDPALGIHARGSVGMAYHPLRKVTVVFGGTTYNGMNISGPSKELNVLQTSPTDDRTKCKWETVSANGDSFYARSQPLMMFVPERGAILMMGGCEESTAGNFINCRPFNEADLLTIDPNFTASPSRISLYAGDPDGRMPVERSSPCVVRLENGLIFMYGGNSATGALQDAWTLDISTSKWNAVPLPPLDAQGRGGATCQVVGPDQVMVIGGKLWTRKRERRERARGEKDWAKQQC
jgi:hypothetical protein